MKPEKKKMTISELILWIVLLFCAPFALGMLCAALLHFKYEWLVIGGVFLVWYRLCFIGWTMKKCSEAENEDFFSAYGSYSTYVPANKPFGVSYQNNPYVKEEYLSMVTDMDRVK